MFKFNFLAEDESNQDNSTNDQSFSNEIPEADGNEIASTNLHNKRASEFSKYYFSVIGQEFQLIDFKYVEELVDKSSDLDTSVIKAIKLNSDVIKGVYEGRKRTEKLKSLYFTKAMTIF